MLTFRGQDLTVDDIAPFFRGPHRLRLAPRVRARIARSHETLRNALSKGQQIYGVTTGFGALVKVLISPADQVRLQENLVRSHAAGVGEPFPHGIVRATIALKALNFGLGFSGVRYEVVRRLIEFLDHDLLPVVPSQGSVGASGDLAPLAHISLALIGEGEVHWQGRTVPAMVALREAGLKPLTLGPKEGLSLINGTQVSAALAARGILRMTNLVRCADIAGAISVEGLLFSRKAFHSSIHRLKRHPGQQESAENLWRLLEGSRIVESHRDCEKVQDPYSFRCIPHVHGASRELLSATRRIVENEMNSVSDNPILFPGRSEPGYSGHFHAEAVGQAMDALGIAAAEIGAISERRLARLTDAREEGLPPFLAGEPGLESGFMAAQVTAAALASENKTLAFPASVDSIPTSANQEDFVSMAPGAGRKLHRILDNVASILAIELLAGIQALDLRRPLLSGRGTHAAREIVRSKSKFSKRDRSLSKDIEAVAALVDSGRLVGAVERTVALR